jgi:hypothetical protein
VLAANGVLSRIDGFILVIGAVVYTFAVIRARDARRGKPQPSSPSRTPPRRPDPVATARCWTWA